MTEAVIVGRTRGGAEWTPQFVVALNPETCIGCGRCYKVCPRDVFTLVDKADIMEVDEDDYDEDDELKVMTIHNAMDCIGCTSCAKVCPKSCHTHQPLAG